MHNTSLGELTGKVALVTGGSRGIGRGIALKLAQAGADVIVNYLEREDAAHEVGDWIKGMNRRVMLWKADVCREDKVEKMYDRIASEFGKLDIVVSNVGPFMIKPALSMSLEDWDLMLRGNLISAFLIARGAVPLIERRENGGSIVFIGAPNADRIGSQSESPAYSIAKTGVIILAQTLARDLGPNSIRVNVVNPGFIENDSMTPRMRQWMPNEVPLGSIGSPANIADAVEFLVSDRGSYISGAVLNVHGALWV